LTEGKLAVIFDIVPIGCIIVLRYMIMNVMYNRIDIMGSIWNRDRLNLVANNNAQDTGRYWFFIADIWGEWL